MLVVPKEEEQTLGRRRRGRNDGMPFSCILPYKLLLNLISSDTPNFQYLLRKIHVLHKSSTAIPQGGYAGTSFILLAYIKYR